MTTVIVGILVLLAFANFAGGLAFGSISGSEGVDSAPPLSPTGGIVRFNAQQIAQVARRAGFTGSGLAIAVAVAMAESGGNTVAYNPETAAGTPDGLGSYGLWQIYLKAHPEFSGRDLFDPDTNGNAAYRVFQQAGYSFNPWSTFKNNAYASHLEEATRYSV